MIFTKKPEYDNSQLAPTPIYIDRFSTIELTANGSLPTPEALSKKITPLLDVRKNTIRYRVDENFSISIWHESWKDRVKYYRSEKNTILIEFQRREGDVIDFNSFFREMKTDIILHNWHIINGLLESFKRSAASWIVFSSKEF